MAMDESAVFVTEDELDFDAIASQVAAKLGGRLRDFEIKMHEDGMVLRGRAATYHVKQLAQHEVMRLTAQSILTNRIVVR